MRAIPYVATAVTLLLGGASCSKKDPAPAAGTPTAAPPAPTPTTPPPAPVAASDPACAETNAITVAFGKDVADAPPSFTLKNTIAFAQIDRPDKDKRGRAVSIAYGNYDLRDTLSPRSTVPYNDPKAPGELAIVVEFHTDQVAATFEQELEAYRKIALVTGDYAGGFGAAEKHFEVGVNGPGGGPNLTTGKATVTTSTPTRVCGTFEAANDEGTKVSGTFNVAVKESQP